MKILHVIDSLEMGGAEKMLIDFIKQYKNSYKQDSHYVVSLNENNPLLKEIRPFIDDFACLRFHKLTFWKAAYQLNRCIKKWKVDTIHTHLFYATIVARLARSFNNNLRIVTTYHNMEYCSESPFYSWKLPFIDKLTVPHSNYHPIFITKPVADCITRQIPGISKFTILSNFVSKEYYPKYQFKNNNQLSLVAVGNLSTVKNHIYVLKEIKMLNDKRVCLDIYGKGDLDKELSLFIKEHALQVQLKGHAKISSELLSNYDAFLMPSLSEGMPLALIEAIVTGLPSIVTDLPQLRETAEDAAIYFELKEGKLCAILEQLLRDKSALKYIAQETGKLREKFQIKNYVDAVRNIYSQVEL
jgi:glycosyltransferase involved in cell wall biosynthesis